MQRSKCSIPSSFGARLTSIATSVTLDDVSFVLNVHLFQLRPVAGGWRTHVPQPALQVPSVFLAAAAAQHATITSTLAVLLVRDEDGTRREPEGFEVSLLNRNRYVIWGFYHHPARGVQDFWASGTSLAILNLVFSQPNSQTPE